MGNRMTSRSEFGHSRTTCNCGICQMNCRHIPGFLLPSDLERLIPPGTDALEWAESNLLASPGALVKSGNRTFRIPTLVPATKPDGSCIHYTNDGKCDIHENSPFGCAFFDCNSGADSYLLSAQGLGKVLGAHLQISSIYAQIWAHLMKIGKQQRRPDALRRRMDEQENLR
jgi:hypothetical protein